MRIGLVGRTAILLLFRREMIELPQLRIGLTGWVFECNIVPVEVQNDFIYFVAFLIVVKRGHSLDIRADDSCWINRLHDFVTLDFENGNGKTDSALPSTDAVWETVFVTEFAPPVIFIRVVWIVFIGSIGCLHSYTRQTVRLSLISLLQRKMVDLPQMRIDIGRWF